SNFDTVLGVFTGSSFGALVRFASDAGSGGGTSTSRVPSAVPGPATLSVVAGTVFQIRVRGINATGGNIILGINTPCANPPAVITAITPNSGQHGQILAVAVTGRFTHFVQGGTLLNFGEGITANEVTVADPTH